MRQLSEFPDAHLRVFNRPDPPAEDRLSNVFLIGICGTGMGSLAGLFRESGCNVTGSDSAAYPPMSLKLAEMGIHVHEGFNPEHLTPTPDLVVVGNACIPMHVEAAEARKRNLAQVSFPEALARYFIGRRKSLVVAGTHGKTTATSMLVHVLQTAGLDPGFLVGGVMNNGNRSYAVGCGEHFVVEGDEYDSAYFDKRPKFLLYRPTTAIITSIEFDHADIYDSWDDYLVAFKEFAGLVPTSGLLVVNIDDPQTARLASSTVCRFRTYGLESPDAHVTARNIHPSVEGQTFSLVVDGEIMGTLSLPMNGRHNLLNALGVCSVALDEGIPMSVVKDGLRTFKGIQRRQQIRGKAGDVIVVDDFAHHPTAVRATLQASRERWAERRIVAVFEPRSNSSRRKVFESGYSEAFIQADAVFLSTPPFRHNDDASNFMDIDVVLERIRTHGIHAETASSADDLLDPLLAFLEPGDIVVVMSNGSFGNIHERILSGLSDVE